MTDCETRRSTSATFGLLAALLGTALWVIGADMFNLITELVGGARVTVLEEEVALQPTQDDTP